MNNTFTIRKTVGIDISKDTFVSSVGYLDSTQEIRIVSTKTFPNQPNGFEQLLSWTNSFGEQSMPVSFVMEATGVYYEPLAYFLFQKQFNIHVILPNVYKTFAQSLNIKSKTDKIDAQILCRLGLERKLKVWNPISPQMRLLRQLSREMQALKDQRTVLKNELHAYQYSFSPSPKSVERIEKHIDFLNQQLTMIEVEIKEIVNQDSVLKERIDNVCTLKGVAIITAISIISETNGFALFHSKAQVVSYAGYDVTKRESGSSVKAKERMSKKGNKRIRKSLYFPSITASRYEPDLKKKYEAITERTGIKMKGNVAIQRKLLVLIYTLFKTNQPYDTDYKKNRQDNSMPAPAYTA